MTWWSWGGGGGDNGETTKLSQAGRRGDSNEVFGTRKESIRNDVAGLISTWESMNVERGGGGMSLDVPSEHGGGGGRRRMMDL